LCVSGAVCQEQEEFSINAFEEQELFYKS